MHDSRRHNVISKLVFTYCSVIAEDSRLPLPEYLHLSLLTWILFGPRKAAEPRSHVNILLVSWRRGDAIEA